MRGSRVRVPPSAPVHLPLRGIEVPIIAAQPPTTIVVPAAGKGTRLHPLTLAISKEMLPLGRKPVLDHVVAEALAAGIRRTVFIVSPDKHDGTQYYGEAGQWAELEFAFAVQQEQLGLGHAVLQAEDAVGGRSFAVALGDSVIYSPEVPPPFQRLLAAFCAMDAAGVILVQRHPVEDAGRYGIVKPKSGVAEPFEIADVIEKPGQEQLRTELSADGEFAYAIAGRYALRPVVFDYLRNLKPGALGEFQLTDAIRGMLADGHRVWCVPLRPTEKRRDIGTFRTYFEAFCLAALEDSDCGDYLRKVLHVKAEDWT